VQTLYKIVRWIAWDFWPQPLILCHLFQFGTVHFLFWQNIKISSQCWNLPCSETAGICQNADDPQPIKTSQNRTIFRELNSVTLEEMQSKLLRQTFDLFIATWITTHLVCNSSRSTALLTDISNNQVPSTKSWICWSADITP